MNLKIVKHVIRSLSIFCLIISLLNCGGNNGSSDRAVPSQNVIMDTSNGGIANGETNVSRSPMIVLSFYTAMDPSSINSNSILLVSKPISNQSTNKLSTNMLKVNINNITANESNTIFSFSPAEALNSNANYTIIVNNLAKTASGKSVTGEFSFTTGESIIPMVSIVNPSNGATNLSLVPGIQIKFSSTVLNVNSTNVTIHSGSPTGNLIPISAITAGSDNTYTFSSESQLLGNSFYYITLGNGITDILGNPLSQTTFSFATGDYNYPTANIINPSNGATNVSLRPTIVIQFSESVNNVNLTSVSLHALSPTGENVAIGAISESSSNIYTFIPESKLLESTIYYVVLESSITNSLGYYLPPTKFNFTIVGQSNFLLVGQNGSISSLSPLHQLSNITLPDIGLSNIAYGNGVAVTVGTNGVILSSTDGINWAIESSHTINYLDNIQFVNGKFFAVGDSLTIASSTDGINWTIESTSTNNQVLYSVTYKGGNYYIIGDCGIKSCLYYSSGDGNWIRGQAIADGIGFYGIANNNESLVVVGLDWAHDWQGVIYSSSDGVNWQLESTTSNALYDVTYANNKFIAVGQNSQIYTSPNGHAWTQTNTSIIGDLWRASYQNNKFDATGDRQILTSTDGLVWESASVGLADNAGITGISYFNDKYLSVGYAIGDDGGYIYQSADGNTWSAESFALTQDDLSSVAYGNGEFVAVSYSGAIAISSNGTSWSMITPTGLPIYSDFKDITYNNGYFIAVGRFYDPDIEMDVGLIARSADGASWSYSSINNVDFAGITYGEGKFVAVGESMSSDGYTYGVGKIYTSLNGADWSLAYITPESLPYENSQINSITYGRNKFVAVGVNEGDDSISLAIRSTDGVNWTTESLPFRNYLSSVTYGQDMYVAVGDLGGIFTSSDGIRWEDRSVGDLNKYFYHVTYGVDQFIIVGEDGDILTSNDAITWNALPKLNGICYGSVIPY